MRDWVTGRTPLPYGSDGDYPIPMSVELQTGLQLLGALFAATDVGDLANWSSGEYSNDVFAMRAHHTAETYDTPESRAPNFCYGSAVDAAWYKEVGRDSTTNIQIPRPAVILMLARCIASATPIVAIPDSWAQPYVYGTAPDLEAAAAMLHHARGFRAGG